MAFTPKDWRDSPDTSTPITAGALEDLETRVTNYSDVAAPTSKTVVFSTAAALQTAIDAVSAAGGGDVVVKASSSNLTLDQKITVPHSVNLRGEGPYATQFVCTTAGAGIAFGSPAATSLSGLGNRGGESGGFSIYGGIGIGTEIATQPFAVHDCVQRSFKDIDQRYSAAHGFTLRLGQNCSFENVNAENNIGAGLLIDEGAGGHSFERCEFTLNGGGNLLIKETTGLGPYAYPSHIGFTDCVIERIPSGATETSDVIFETGDYITFHGCNFSWGANASLGDGCLILVDASRGTSFVGNLKFTDCWFFGDSATGRMCDAFQVKTFCRISLSGSNRFQNPGTKDPGRGGAGVVGGAVFAVTPAGSPVINVAGYQFSGYNTFYYDLTAATSSAGLSFVLNRQGAPITFARTDGSGYIEFANQSVNWPSASGASSGRMFGRVVTSKYELAYRMNSGSIQPLITEGGRAWSIAAAGALTLTVSSDPLYIITGNTTITSIATTDMLGKVVTLKFSGTPTVTAGASIKLAGGVNFVATADDTLTLACDGSAWYEVARSVNA